MSINYGVIVYSKVSGEIIRFIECDAPVTPALTASLEKSLSREIQEPFYVSPASMMMCKYFETHQDDLRR